MTLSCAERESAQAKERTQHSFDTLAVSCSLFRSCQLTATECINKVSNQCLSVMPTADPSPKDQRRLCCSVLSCHGVCNLIYCTNGSISALLPFEVSFPHHEARATDSQQPGLLSHIDTCIWGRPMPHHAADRDFTADMVLAATQKCASHTMKPGPLTASSQAFCPTLTPAFVGSHVADPIFMASFSSTVAA